MSRVVYWFRVVLAIAVVIPAFVSLWHAVDLWHDLALRAQYMLASNKITTTTAGVLLGFLGGFVMFMASLVSFVLASTVYPNKAKTRAPRQVVPKNVNRPRRTHRMRHTDS